MRVELETCCICWPTSSTDIFSVRLEGNSWGEAGLLALTKDANDNGANRHPCRRGKNDLGQAKEPNGDQNPNPEQRWNDFRLEERAFDNMGKLTTE